MTEKISLYKKYTIEEVHDFIGGNISLIKSIAKEWGKRKRSGIKCENDIWLIPGGEILAIKNEMRERELEA